MSLVNEALKKARLEAARQEAARRGIPLPGMQRPAARSIGPAALFKVGAALAAVAVAVLIFFAGRSSSSNPPAGPTPVAALEAAAPSPDVEPPPAAIEPATARSEPVADRSAPEPAPAVAVAETPSPRAAPRNDSIDARGSRASQSRVRTEWTPDAAPAPPATRKTESGADVTPPREVRIAAADPQPEETAAPAPETVVRKLELPGSIQIELGGIAWSEERPFALINGRVVGPGDQVETLTVVEIEPKHVELRGGEGHYLVRIK